MTAKLYKTQIKFVPVVSINILFKYIRILEHFYDCKSEIHVAEVSKHFNSRSRKYRHFDQSVVDFITLLNILMRTS